MEELSMFLNKKHKKLYLILIYITLTFFILFKNHVFAYENNNKDTLKVSLILGDHYTKVAVEALKEIKKDGIQKLEIKVFPQKDIKNLDLSYISKSNLIIINIMGRQLVEILRKELSQAIKNGGKVYAVAASGSYNDEMKEMGIIFDERIEEYYKNGGVKNIKNMIYYALTRDFGLNIKIDNPEKLPEFAVYDYKSKKVYLSTNGYLSAKKDELDKRNLIGIIFYKTSYISFQTTIVDVICQELERQGFGVIPVYGYPSELAIEKFFFSDEGKPLVRAVVALGLKIGVRPESAVPVLSKLGVPVINAITLYSQSEEEWKKSMTGLDIFERTWQIALPELGGIIQPIVVGSKETFRDSELQTDYIIEKPIPERIKMLVKRVKAWVNLKDKLNKDKKIAIIYYNYPPGKQNIGAAYLNVLPESLYEILKRLKEEGYTVPEVDKAKVFEDVLAQGRNIGNWAKGELERLIKAYNPILIPVETYKAWLEKLPSGFRKEVIRTWGQPEASNIMTFSDTSNKKYFVIPAVKYGNILLLPQPSRGLEQDVEKLYHDMKTPPHHQYIAFYLWLKKEFQADAIIHLGTHGTHEWLPGKEIGLSPEDPPEALIQDIPNIYPYIVDDVGEGLQAKRRGMAVIIDHMTPPLDKTTLNKELTELYALINDYHSAKDKSPLLAEAKLKEVSALSKKIGILKDLGLEDVKDEKDLEELEHYLEEIRQTFNPYGLHTFGRAPEERFIRATAEAILSIEKNLSSEEKEKKLKEIEDKIRESAKREVDSLILALSGRYISSGPGNDPIRNPDSLPTGKNFYAFDPSRIPSKAAYEMGAKLAKKFLEDYKRRHGNFPDKLAFVLWAVETIRHEGVMESQILYLLGVRPKWDERGRVSGLELIPREELSRPRIDVVLTISGLYRDLFSNLVHLLDQAVSLAREAKEEDNLVRNNVLSLKDTLIKQGIPEDKALRLASVRIFSEPPGDYGTRIDKAIAMSNTWEKEVEVARLYINRMSHLYGQGFWGSVDENGKEVSKDLSLFLFKKALSGTKAALHSRGTNIFATLDNDDFFQYLGGLALAIRTIDGKSPELFITNLANPHQPKQERLEKFMGRELRGRYLNPEWIKAMMKEGYAGARFIDKVVEHLWGWQVTAPEVVDAAKWQEMYETYVVDKYGLNIKELFRKANNLWAYQSVVARMLETVRKGYWKPEKEVVEHLAKEYAETAIEVGLACCDHTCNNPFLTEFTAKGLLSVPGLKPLAKPFLNTLAVVKGENQASDNPNKKEFLNRDITFRAKKNLVPGGSQRVKGFEMEDVKMSGFSSAPLPWLYILFFFSFLFLVYIGWRRTEYKK
jgi:cobaltochelatase CobN